MNLLEYIAAGGPGSGCNPAVGQCGRKPGRGKKYGGKIRVKNGKTYQMRLVPGGKRGKWVAKWKRVKTPKAPKNPKRLPKRPPPAPRKPEKGKWVKKSVVIGPVVHTQYKSEQEVYPGGKQAHKDPLKEPHYLKGQFEVKAATYDEAQNRHTVVMDAERTKDWNNNAQPGEGTTVIVHRRLGGGRMEVMEIERGPMGYIAGNARVFKFNNHGYGAGFVQRRYGIGLPLPRKV